MHEDRPELPEAGLLVADEVLRVAGVSEDGVWDALEAAAVPLAVEYFPVSEAAITRYRTVPVNAAVQQSVVEIVEALNPKSPTLYRVVLPKGAELVKAAGTSGFRGFARGGGKITAQAVLKPVAAGGAVVAGWPIFAVASTVMVVDMVAQRELRAHQRRVETILGRQEERHYNERIKDQRSADAQLTRAISLMLDGQKPSLDLALKSAYDEFHRSQQFLKKHRGVIEQLVDDDGKVDHRRLEKVLGGDIAHFLRELHLARAAIAIRRKALLADAAAVALTDPANPYTALRTFVDSQVQELEEADAVARELTQQLTEIQLKGGWSVNKALKKQERIRASAAGPEAEEGAELCFLRTASGEIVQVITIEDGDVEEEPSHAITGPEIPLKPASTPPEGPTA